MSKFVVLIKDEWGESVLGKSNDDWVEYTSHRLGYNRNIPAHATAFYDREKAQKVADTRNGHCFYLARGSTTEVLEVSPIMKQVVSYYKVVTEGEASDE